MSLSTPPIIKVDDDDIITVSGDYEDFENLPPPKPIARTPRQFSQAPEVPPKPQIPKADYDEKM